MSSAPACLRCGACCFSQLETYVPVTGAGYAQLGDDAERLSIFLGNRCYMRMQDGHCSALVLEPDSAQFVCSVYARRPTICRELARESAECEAERTLKAERPGAALLLRKASRLPQV